MRHRIAQTIKNIQSRPMKSPSPDYYCSNKATKTSSPFKQVNQYLYNKSSARKSPKISTTLPLTNKQPIQPFHYQQNQQNQGIENDENNGMDSSRHLDERIKLVKFETFNQNQNDQSLNKNDESASRAVIERQEKEISEYRNMIGSLQKEIMMKNKKIEQLESRIDKAGIVKSRYLQNSHSSPLKIQQSHSPSRFGNSQQASHTSQLQFFKQKIAYLQSQLKTSQDNLIQKQHQLSRLSEKLETTNYLLQNQMQNYTKIINKLKNRLSKYEHTIAKLKDGETEHHENNFKRVYKLIKYEDWSEQDILEESVDTPMREIEEFSNEDSEQRKNDDKSILNESQKLKEDLIKVTNQKGGSMNSLKNISDYDIRQCESEDDEHHTRIHQASQHIRKYYQKILTEKTQFYHEKIASVQNQLISLKQLLKKAYQQHQNHECKDCPILKSQLEHHKNISSLQLASLTKKTQMQATRIHELEDERSEMEQTAKKCLQESTNSKNIRKYRNYLLKKLSKYWDVNLSAMMLSPVSSRGELNMRRSFI